jgi:peroxiredoxin
MALNASDILAGALKAGDSMPEFTLSDARGETMALRSLLTSGPVVISFFRGDWCDYCAMELAALAAIHDQIHRLGSKLIAISPQAPDARCRRETAEVPFPLLFDREAKVARRCGITFTLAEELRPIYIAAGRKPPARGADNWLLPLPAIYVLDWTGEIVFSYLDTDYTSRFEPTDVLTVLTPLVHRMAQDQARRNSNTSSAGAPIPRSTRATRIKRSTKRTS